MVMQLEREGQASLSKWRVYRGLRALCRHRHGTQALAAAAAAARDASRAHQQLHAVRQWRAWANAERSLRTREAAATHLTVLTRARQALGRWRTRSKSAAAINRATEQALQRLPSVRCRRAIQRWVAWKLGTQSEKAQIVRAAHASDRHRILRLVARWYRFARHQRLLRSRQARAKDAVCALRTQRAIVRWKGLCSQRQAARAQRLLSLAWLQRRRQASIFTAWRRYTELRRQQRHVHVQAARTLRHWSRWCRARQRQRVQEAESTEWWRSQLLRRVMLAWRRASHQLARERFDEILAGTFRRRVLLYRAWMWWQRCIRNTKRSRGVERAAQLLQRCALVRWTMQHWKQVAESGEPLRRATRFHRRFTLNHIWNHWRGVCLQQQRRRCAVERAARFWGIDAQKSALQHWRTWAMTRHQHAMRLRLLRDEASCRRMHHALLCWHRVVQVRRRAHTLQTRHRALVTSTAWSQWQSRTILRQTVRRSLSRANTLVQREHCRGAWIAFVARVTRAEAAETARIRAGRAHLLQCRSRRLLTHWRGVSRRTSFATWLRDRSTAHFRRRRLCQALLLWRRLLRERKRWARRWRRAVRVDRVRRLWLAFRVWRKRYRRHQWLAHRADTIHARVAGKLVNACLVHWKQRREQHVRRHEAYVIAREWRQSLLASKAAATLVNAAEEKRHALQVRSAQEHARRVAWAKPVLRRFARWWRWQSRWHRHRRAPCSSSSTNLKERSRRCAQSAASLFPVDLSCEERLPYTDRSIISERMLKTPPAFQQPADRPSRVWSAFSQAEETLAMAETPFPSTGIRRGSHASMSVYNATKDESSSPVRQLFQEPRGATPRSTEVSWLHVTPSPRPQPRVPPFLQHCDHGLTADTKVKENETFEPKAASYRRPDVAEKLSRLQMLWKRRERAAEEDEEELARLRYQWDRLDAAERQSPHGWSLRAGLLRLEARQAEWAALVERGNQVRG